MKFIQSLFCKHEEYFETMACDAICDKCHKNLGFIGNIRKDKTKKEVGEQRWWK
jgi:hypothetical protein